MGKVAIKVTRVMRHVKRKKMLIERMENPRSESSKIFSQNCSFSLFLCVRVLLEGLGFFLRLDLSFGVTTHKETGDQASGIIHYFLSCSF